MLHRLTSDTMTKQNEFMMSTMGMLLLLLLLPMTAGLPIDTGDFEAAPLWWAVPCVAVVTILLALGCVCCREDGLKVLGVENGTQVSHLPMSNVLAEEITIFPPPASQLAFTSQPSYEDKVRFEPLPKIFPRGGGASKRPLRPAHYSGELGSRPSTIHDWFDDPQANFPRQQLQYLQELGTGWFGQAVKGEAQNLGGIGTSSVVVKILRTDATPTEHLCFLHEVQPYRVLRHENILRLLGRCLESDPFLIILEDSAMDLKRFLVQRRSNSDTFFASGALLHIARAVTSGLQYMHRYGFAHVDLAARNCVITRDQLVKVGDYGTSIQAYKEDYYVVGDVAIPIRWSAPESIHCTEIALEAREITKEANVWSLGVLLWELATLCSTPYSSLSDDEVIQRVIMQKRLILERPKVVSPHMDRLYQVMTWCWNDPLERPTVQEVGGLLAHLCNHKDSTDFEARWNSLRPVMVREHNLAHPAAGDMSFESNFTPAQSPQEELTSMQISEAIQDLDAILAAESSEDSKTDMPTVDSLCSTESKENSLGFKKSASVEDLLKEGPEKVAQLFRITVIDDDDVGEPRSLSSLADESAKRIWSSAEALSTSSARRERNIWKTADDSGAEMPSSAVMRSLEELASRVAADVSSGMSGSGGGSAGSIRCSSPYDTTAFSTNRASCVSSAYISTTGCDSPHLNPVCAEDDPERNRGSRSDRTQRAPSDAPRAPVDCPHVLDFSRSSEGSSSSPRTGGATSPELCTTGDSSGNLYVTAMESEPSEGSVLSTTDISLVEGFSESVASFVTAQPEDDTSECSEATLADDGCADEWEQRWNEQSPSLLSDGTVDDAQRELRVECNNSLDMSDTSLLERMEELRGTVDEVVAQENGFLDAPLSARQATLSWSEGSEGRERCYGASHERYKVNEEQHQDVSPTDLMGELCEEEEILTVDTATNEITVRPAPPSTLLLQSEEVLAGGDRMSDTDDTSSTGTSCSTTSGSFECLTQDRVSRSAEDVGMARDERGVEIAFPSATWDRSATSTKGVLKSSLYENKEGASQASSTSLRKSVSFNDVIRSVYHYPPEEELPTPRSADLDYSSFQDWEFQSSPEDDFRIVEEMESSDEDNEDPRALPRYPPGGLEGIDNACVNGDGNLLTNERPPWDSMSDLSCLDGESEDEPDAAEKAPRDGLWNDANANTEPLFVNSNFGNLSKLPSSAAVAQGSSGVGNVEKV
ncbi:uncharacterized protein LOC135392000 isoform X2 [Ornithodoros turicata]|uniref:uncharacterized protein LOC135392000 isoform X2 n=1 Tax=Ornithodoros turicata TaxID=34597 RepID=UPI00313A49AE